MAFEPYCEAVAFPEGKIFGMTRLGFRRFAGLLGVVGLLLPMALPLRCAAQAAPAPSATVTATGKATTTHRVHHHRKVKPTPVVVAPVVPPPPPPPVPPAEQPPVPARITYRHGDLRIDANNASLTATLKEVSLETGMDIQGMDHDERIYGQYGPGPITSTLMHLLDGAGYSYVIFGGGGDKPPSKILLTPASGGGGGGSVPSTMPTQYVPPPATPQDPNAMTDPSQPVEPKSPQEIFDEMRRMHPGRSNEYVPH